MLARSKVSVKRERTGLSAGAKIPYENPIIQVQIRKRDGSTTFFSLFVAVCNDHYLEISDKEEDGGGVGIALSRNAIFWSLGVKDHQ